MPEFVFITPPPGRDPVPMTYFMADPVNHPGNDEHAMLVKEPGEELDPACCCVDLQCCVPERECTDFPTTIFLTLSGFNCLLDDTWELTGGCSELGSPGSGLFDIVYLGEFTIGTCQFQLRMTCRQGEVDRWVLEMNLDDTGATSSVSDHWELPFAGVSCDPLHLVAVGPFTGTIVPPSELEVCDCALDVTPSGEATE